MKFSSYRGSITVLFIIILCCQPISGFSLDKRIVFDHLTNRDGLLNNTVLTITQDDQGFMWFGTVAGLCRYDGYDFVPFVHKPEDTNTISDNVINTIYQDSAGVLWVGTSVGLNAYDQERLQWRRFTKSNSGLTHDNIRQVYPVNDSLLWVATEGGAGLQRFNTRTGAVDLTPLRREHTPTEEFRVRSLLIDSVDLLWIGTFNDGLYRFESSSHTLKHYLPDAQQPEKSISDLYVTDIVEDAEGLLWFSTHHDESVYNYGLNCYDRRVGKFTHYFHEPGNPHSLSNSSILALHVDHTGLLWVGTFDGLNYFDKTTGRFHAYHHFPNDPGSISDKEVRAIYEDQAGIVWVGTGNGGLNKFNIHNQNFITFSHDPNNSNSLSENIVRSIFEDHTGILWVGTISGGLNRVDRATETFTHYQSNPNNSNSLCDNDVTAIMEDNDHLLWIGTWNNGLNKFDPNTETFLKHYKYDPDNIHSINSNSIQVIYQDQRGQMWVGTQYGLDLFDPVSERFTTVHSGQLSIQSNAIYEDEYGHIWFGAWSGLYWLDSETLHYAAIPELENSHVQSITQDQNGLFWIGSFGGGLLSLAIEASHGAEPTVIEPFRYTEDDGLPTNNIFGSLVDRDGKIWMSTSHGLSRFDPKTKTFRNFNLNDGLQGNSFFWGAYYQNSAGELFFGGENGLNIFAPDQIRDNQFRPPIKIVGFRTFEELVHFDRAYFALQKIELTYQENFFSFEFSALDFTKPVENQYAYRLEGYDPNWIQCGTRRQAYYTKVEPGNYTFKVIGSNNDGIWNEEGTSVKVIIHPPFWQTWWFYALEMALILTVIFGIYRFNIRRVERRKNEELRELELKRRHEELERAQMIQRTMIPKVMPVVPCLQVAGDMNTAALVGGDYYDVIVSGDGSKVYFVMADVSGKGVPASLLMVEARTILRSLAALSLPPRIILKRLNQQIYPDIQAMNDPMLITMLLLCWDIKQKKMTYAGAGHEYIIAYRAATGLCDVIHAGGMWLGIKEDIAELVTEETLTVNPNDTILLYTDGVTEAHNPQKEMFGMERLHSFMLKYGHLSSVNFITQLKETLREFSAGNPQHDDITLLVIKVEEGADCRMAKIS